jgi:3-hydroxy-3-methylglutaryl CoA synthase
MYACVCLTNVFHHCKERTTTGVQQRREQKKRKKKDNKQNWQYQTYKKYVHQPRDRDREERKKNIVLVLLEGEKVRKLALIVVVDVTKQIFCKKDK